MRIDSHQHFWDLTTGIRYPWMPSDPASPLRRRYLPDDLAPILARNGFDGTVVVQAAHAEEEADWLLELAQAHSFMKGVVAWVDLTASALPSRLDALQRDPKFKGVRHQVHDEPDDRWLLRDDVLRGLRELERRDIPYDLLLRPQHLRYVPQLADAVPDLRMVIDHLAKPHIAEGLLEGWAEDMERAAQIPRLHAKLSGMITEADHRHWTPEHLHPYIEHTLNVFGPDRLMFGSDWPVCLLAGTWDEVLSACRRNLGRLDSAAQAAILGNTAARFYGL